MASLIQDLSISWGFFTTANTSKYMFNWSSMTLRADINTFFTKIFIILDESLKDNATGLYSHSRIISMLIAFGATVFMWKLIIAGGMSIEYFIGYLTYGTGHQTINKFLDNKDPQRAIALPKKDDPKD
jgi:hypothetical protein